jgi:hypothetical protein
MFGIVHCVSAGEHKVIAECKTHFDIGYNDLATKTLARYAITFVVNAPDVLLACCHS